MSRIRRNGPCVSLLADWPAKELARARRHLSRRDPVLKRLIAGFGPCTLRLNPDHFAALVRSIIAQQISTKAAASIRSKLESVIGRSGVTVKGVLALSDEALRSAGLSAAKARAIRDLATKVHQGAVPLHEFHGKTDEEVIAGLLPVWGIGRWTAEMFLIFSLGRPDVLPVHDLGLRAGVRREYGLKELPDKEALTALAEPWQPYRSIATWYFWRSFGPVPQSETPIPARSATKG